MNCLGRKGPVSELSNFSVELFVHFLLNGSADYKFSIVRNLYRCIVAYR